MFDYADITIKGQPSMASVRETLVGEHCYLDGHAAIVQGRLLPYGRISTLDGKRSFEYSWQAIQRVMAKDRLFYS